MENKIICKDVLGQMIDSTIDRARNGNTEAAREILEEFCEAIKANTNKNGRPYRKPSGLGTQIDERILRYVSECFQKILDGGPGARVDANHALRIVEAGKKGNKKTKTGRERELDLGYEVMKCFKTTKEEKRKSNRQRLIGELTPLDKAIDEVAKKYHRSTSTITNAYKEWNRVLKVSMEELQNMGK